MSEPTIGEFANYVKSQPNKMAQLGKFTVKHIADYKRNELGDWEEVQE